MTSAAPTCRVVKRHVDALVDGELDSSAQIDFEKHLAGCVICREHAMFAQSMKRATKSALGGVKAPEQLRLRVLTALDSSGPRADRVGATHVQASRAPARRGDSPDSRLVRYGLPVAAAAVVALGFATQTDESADTLSLEAAAAPVWQDVVRRHEREHPAEVQGSPQQMASWFQRKLEFPARPVTFVGGDFGGQDAQLVGGRISNVRERDAAAFYYQVHGHRVTVMVFEPPAGLMAGGTFRGAEHVQLQGHDVYYRNVHGYTVPMTQMGGLTYAFTSDMDRDAMIRLAASAHVGY